MSWKRFRPAADSQGLVRDSDDWWVFIDWQAELNKQASRRCSSTAPQRAASGWRAAFLNRKAGT